MIALIVARTLLALHRANFDRQGKGLTAVDAFPARQTAGKCNRFTTLVDHAGGLVAAVQVRPVNLITPVKGVALPDRQPDIFNINHPFGAAFPPIIEGWWRVLRLP